MAAELEEKGDYRAAEEQYLVAGDWKSVVNMYRNAEMWTDAFRIAKQEGGETAQKQARFFCEFEKLGGTKFIIKYFVKNILFLFDEEFV